MIKEFITRAKRGENVYLFEVRDAFANGRAAVKCVIEPAVGAPRRWVIPLPPTDCPEEMAFVREYFYANIYNLISTLGGKRMTLYIPPSEKGVETLCAELDAVFQTALPRGERTGYGKCLNVTDRVNAAMGCPPFYFEIVRGRCGKEVSPVGEKRPDALAAFRGAVAAADSLTLCGVDIGGTDINLVVAKNGKIIALKEYDWRPQDMTKIEQLIDPILLLVRVMRAALALPGTERGDKLRAALLDKDATDDQMRTLLEEARIQHGDFPMLDGIGVNFPDVVIRDKIVGGETLKTRGIRGASPDYEAEFGRLVGLGELLLAYCKPGGRFRMANDGSLAAYTGAVELAHSGHAREVVDGVFAHTLGTELGTGWIDAGGEIPQIPLEVYNCVIDLGNAPARKLDVFDLRSVCNFNTGIPGTLQKYASQSGAYRLAVEYFSADAPQLYKELLEGSYIEERDGGVYLSTSPKDMRKALLERIMELACTGQPQAERVFREIGRYLAATWRETEFILCPKAKRRVLFGRFVKHPRCFELMQEGASELADIKLEAGDDSLAFTPLMQNLKAELNYTVAQFGQAIGAVYFAANKKTV